MVRKPVKSVHTADLPEAPRDKQSDYSIQLASIHTRFMETGRGDEY